MRRFPFVAFALLLPLFPRARDAQAFRIDARESTQLAFDLSPDGSSLVIDLLGQLWTVPAGGGEARALTNALRDHAEDVDPVFSPDGRWIAFQSDRPDGRGVWLMPAGGGIPRLVARISDDRAWPAWAPDGLRIVLAVSNERLVIVHVDSGEIDTLAISGPPSRAVREPIWSADGRRILFINAPRNSAVGGGIWAVAATGGLARRIGNERLRVLGLSRSPDGRLAFFVRDSTTLKHQLVYADSTGSPIRTLGNHTDITPQDARFSRNGRAVVYHGDGQLWLVATAGGAPRPIPLRARLDASRAPRQLPPLESPAAGASLGAHGFRALELSPDGRRIAMIALDSLWLFAPGERPQAAMPTPRDVDDLSWSPDGTRLAWTAGAERDVYVVDLASATSRKVTALPDQELRPAWSPDGRYIAFFHGPDGWVERRLRVIRSDLAQPVERVDSVLTLAGKDVFGSYHPADDKGQEVLNWSAQSNGIYFLAGRNLVRARLDGDTDTLPLSAIGATFFRIVGDSAAIFVRDDQLWRAHFDTERGVGSDAERLAEVAMYPSVARDGTILFVAGDGLRIRRPDGEVLRLGWPVSYRMAAVQSLLIRRVRLVDPRRGRASGHRDLLLEKGRIARVAVGGSLRPRSDTRVVDAGGRFALPGLIDLHQHVWDDAQPAGMLRYGVTTARDLGSAVARTAAIRDAIAAGVRPGPRIVLGGLQLRVVDNAGQGWSGQFTHALVDTAAISRALALARTFGGSHLKLRMFSRWSDAERIAEHAHANGMRVTGHVAHPLSLVGRMDGKEHVGRAGGYHRLDGFVYDDVVQLMRGSGISVVPTISTFSVAMRLYDDPTLLEQAEIQPFLSPYLRFVARQFPSPGSEPTRRNWDRTVEIMRAATRTLAAGGVRIGAGTDAPQVPWAIHLEMEELVASGLTPTAALAAATHDAAEILGAPSLGCIAPGCAADIVIVDANPLDDIRHTRRIWRVIANGRMHDPPLPIPNAEQE